MKNTHLEHAEDSILTGDLSVLDWFVNPGHLSVKIDGAPAIVWGRNPATGNFFVGTKSVFNKVKIKINESHEEIDTNHNGQVAEILHACFNFLPFTNTIYQGDFIGFGGFSEYTPNTITYQFPRNQGPEAYIRQDRIDAEGYVMTNEFGMFKLVNREVFSHANFNSGRFQTV
jgi:hypothetical protein